MSETSFRALRKSIGWSIQTTAAWLSINERTVHRWNEEHNGFDAPAEVMDAMAAVLASIENIMKERHNG